MLCQLMGFPWKSPELFWKVCDDTSQTLGGTVEEKKQNKNKTYLPFMITMLFL